MNRDKAVPINVPEITRQEAEESYPIYPKLVIRTTKGSISVLTYVISNNGYLAPIRLEYGLTTDKYLHLDYFSRLVLDLCETTDHVKEEFNGWTYFEGKSNFINKDGLVLSIKKIKDYERKD